MWRARSVIRFLFFPAQLAVCGRKGTLISPALSYCPNLPVVERTSRPPRITNRISGPLLGWFLFVYYISPCLPPCFSSLSLLVFLFWFLLVLFFSRIHPFHFPLYLTFLRFSLFFHPFTFLSSYFFANLFFLSHRSTYLLFSFFYSLHLSFLPSSSNSLFVNSIARTCKKKKKNSPSSLM